MKFFNSNVPKVYYSDARHQFYIKSSSLALRPLLYFRKNSKCGNKSETFSINEVIVPIFYQSSSVTSSKVYYSNTRHQFCVNWALLSLWPILHLRKNSKHCKKLVRFFSQYTPNKILSIHQNLNSSRPKVYYSGTRHQFYIKLPSLVLRPFLHFRENSKWSNKLENFSIKNNSKCLNILSKFRCDSIESLLQ